MTKEKDKLIYHIDNYIRDYYEKSLLSAIKKCPNCNIEVESDNWEDDNCTKREYIKEWKVFIVWFDNEDKGKKALGDKLDEIEKDGGKIYAASENVYKHERVFFLYTWRKDETNER